jgi:hypothetical protein
LVLGHNEVDGAREMELLCHHRYCRRIVAWCIADAESAALFKPLFDDAVRKQESSAWMVPMHARYRSQGHVCDAEWQVRCHEGQREEYPINAFVLLGDPGAGKTHLRRRPTHSKLSFEDTESALGTSLAQKPPSDTWASLVALFQVPELPGIRTSRHALSRRGSCREARIAGTNRVAADGPISREKGSPSQA